MLTKIERDNAITHLEIFRLKKEHLKIQFGNKIFFFKQSSLQSNYLLEV